MPEGAKLGPKVVLRLDYVNSLVTTYHILCAPTKWTRKFNPELYAKFEAAIPEADKTEYRMFLESNKAIAEADKDRFRTKLFQDGYEDLKDYYFYGKRTIPALMLATNSILESWQRFEEKFEPHWDDLVKRLEGHFEASHRIAEGYCGAIYGAVPKVIPGKKVAIPGRIEIRVVEGLAPRGFGTAGPMARYVVVPPHYFEDPLSLLELVVHETVAHDAVNPEAYDLQKEVLGDYVYAIEEGLVMLVTQKIIESLDLKNDDRKAWDSIKDQYGTTTDKTGFLASYYLYKEKWPLLKDMTFTKWYKMCLEEIRNKLVF